MQKKSLIFTAIALIVLALGSQHIHARAADIPESAQRIISFSGYQWIVRGGTGGPGPNNWRKSNVWVDGNGHLHMKVSRVDNQWYCAEIWTVDRLGFGTYQFQVTGRIDRLDRNVVLGLFNYPTADVGEDGTNEIDIEIARWGTAGNPNGNYTVWPTDVSLSRESFNFPFTLTGVNSTHRFTWSGSQIYFQSLYGLRDDNTNQFAEWLYAPADAASYIPQQAMPVHINLWLVRGLKPSNLREVEIVIKNFKYTP